MAGLPASYKALVVEKAGGPFTPKEVKLTKPGPGEVLVKVLACGVCHTDVIVSRGEFGHIQPRIPGHEYVGDVVAVGEGVKRFSGGERVGGAWHGGHDLSCRACQRGQFQMCDNVVINSVSRDGGWAQYVLLREEAAVRISPDLDPAETAPLLCAGVTVFNSIRKMHIEQGNLVAIQGVGGLGHLAVQYANRMGYKVAVLSSGSAKRDFAMSLGAHEYIDTSVEDPVQRLKALGGAALILATAPNAKAVSPLVAGLQACGKLCILAPMGDISVSTGDMISGSRSVHGWSSGHALDSEEAIAFAGTHGIKCMVEKFPMEEVTKATEHMLANKVRFRCVLIMDH